MMNDSVSNTALIGSTPSANSVPVNQAITATVGTVSPMLATAEPSARLIEVCSLSAIAAFSAVAASGSNTIAATMYDDPAAADAQLTQLSELLRASLRSTHAQEVPLREEVALVGQYMGLMQARFPGALTWQATLAPGTEELLVPSMSLQPLMENAVRHGALSARGAGRVQLTATILAGDARTAGEEATLELRVWDDGDGVAPGRDPIGAGTGLSATARRLHLLYGARGTLQARNAAGGGFEVVLQLPVRTMACGGDAARTRSASSLNATIPAAHGVASSRSVAG